MYKPTKIIAHCADTRTDQSFSIDDIRAWHTNPKDNKDGSFTYKGVKYASINDLPRGVQNLRGNGWSDVGYHIYFRLDGSIELGRSIYDNGAHCRGENDQLGACFEGGKKPDGSKWDNFTEPQIKAFRWWKETLERIFGYELSVHGHNEFSSKTCPNASVEVLK